MNLTENARKEIVLVKVVSRVRCVILVLLGRTKSQKSWLRKFQRNKVHASLAAREKGNEKIIRVV